MNAAAALAALAQSSPLAAAPPGGSPLVIILVVAAVAIVPFVLLVGTSFVKISVVLGMLRSALGAQDVPSSMVITGLAAILSVHVMAPTVAAMVQSAGPAAARAMSNDLARPGAFDDLSTAWNGARAPVQRFLRANSTDRDRALFLDLARQARTRQPPQPGVALPPPAADDLAVLLPAFVVSEMTNAFMIGFLIFLPFLILDLVIATALTALGMNSLSPTTVSLPFKLLLFIVADGWYLLARALVLGYR